jgi:hypothetical protein
LHGTYLVGEAKARLVIFEGSRESDEKDQREPESRTRKISGRE